MQFSYIVYPCLPVNTSKVPLQIRVFSTAEPPPQTCASLAPSTSPTERVRKTKSEPQGWRRRPVALKAKSGHFGDKDLQKQTYDTHTEWNDGDESTLIVFFSAKHHGNYRLSLSRLIPSLGNTSTPWLNVCFFLVFLPSFFLSRSRFSSQLWFWFHRGHVEEPNGAEGSCAATGNKPLSRCAFFARLRSMNTIWKEKEVHVVHGDAFGTRKEICLIKMICYKKPSHSKIQYEPSSADRFKNSMVQRKGKNHVCTQCHTYKRYPNKSKHNKRQWARKNLHKKAYRRGNVWNGTIFQGFCGTERRPFKMSYFVIKTTMAFAFFLLCRRARQVIAVAN